MSMNVLIPSFEPTRRLLEICNEIKRCGFKKIIVIDDGSDQKYQYIFEKLAEMEVIVLHHKENLGKGAALKTGFKYLHENDFGACITMDSDGQHKVFDVVKVRDVALDNKDSLVLGSRNFDLDYIPWKSKVGNLLTNCIFNFRFKTKLKDTQTGLRAIPKSFYNELINIKENGFEYEIKMLMLWANRKFIEVDIETIYENGQNKSTHFKPVSDTLKIHKVLLGRGI